MTPDNISVISVQEINLNDEAKGNRKNNNTVIQRHYCQIFAKSALGIIGNCVIFTIPWTIIPRTNSIIYPTYWMELLLPISIMAFVSTEGVRLNLVIWTKENALKSIYSYLKIYFINVIPYTLLYISSYIIWSIYLQSNHPMPNLGLIIIPSRVIVAAGFWFLLPTHLQDQQSFRKRLRIYLLYLLWIEVTGVTKEILAYLFIIFPPIGNLLHRS